MTGLSSLSLFVGTSECNAKCAHCAGIPLRQYAPKKDGIINSELISQTIKNCYEQGAKYVTISSSGEPTLSPISVTKTLNLINSYKNEGINFSQINLYTNGIKIGEDKTFCENYLPLWKNLGLTQIYVTLHNIDEKKNAKIYGVKEYPDLDKIITRIDDAKLFMRANLILSKKTINTFYEFISTIEKLTEKNVKNISAWQIKNKKDKIDSLLSLEEKELNKIEKWVKEQNLEHKIKILRENKETNIQKKQKLTLFQNGELTNNWCNK